MKEEDEKGAKETENQKQEEADANQTEEDK